MRQRRTAKRTRGEIDVVELCTALLEGRAAESMAIIGQRRPAWAWVNLPTHGLQVDLAAEWSRLRGGLIPLGSWRAARAVLCGEVLHAAAGVGSVIEAQRVALVPWELDLMTNSRHVTTPIVLIAEGVHRLDSLGTRALPVDRDSES